MTLSLQPLLLRATLALLLGLTTAGTSGAEPLRLVTGTGAPFTTGARDGFLDLLVAEMFRGAGARAEVYTHESSERALVNANNGDDDGVVPRVRGIEAQYPALVMIPEKIFDNDFVAYTLDRDLPVADWKALEPHHVAFIRGWRIFEANLTGARDVTRTRDARQLFALLREGRVDVVLYERWQGLWQAREAGMAIRLQLPPLARQEMFAYLHRKHAAIAPRVAATLAEMKRDGSYRRLFEATLTQLERTPQRR